MSLLARWPLVEKRGVTAFDSIGSNDGTWDSGELVTNGSFDNAFWTADELDGWTRSGGAEDGSNFVNENANRMQLVSEAAKFQQMSMDVEVIVSGREYSYSIDVDGATNNLAFNNATSGEKIDTWSSTGAKAGTFIGADSKLVLKTANVSATNHIVDDFSVKQNIFSDGRGIIFNGTDELITVTSFAALDSMTEGTISCWVKLAAVASGDGNILHRVALGNGWILQLDTSGVFRFIVDDGVSQTASSNEVPVVGVWYHVVGVFTGGVVSIYINGVLQDDTDTYGAINLSTGDDITIGAIAGGTNLFNGSLSDVRIYNEALSSGLIASMYNEVVKDIRRSLRR